MSKAESIQALASKLGLSMEVRELSTYSNTQDLTISTIPATALDTISTDSQNGWLLNVNYSSKDSNFSSKFDDAKVIQGETMLIWQAIAQIRIFMSGSPNIELGNEEAVFANMADAL
jgi:shikimate dehydrogenase